MVATGFGLDDKLPLSGGVMSGTLVFQGAPAFTVENSGAAAVSGTATLNGTTAVSVATAAVLVDETVTVAGTEVTVTSTIQLTVQPGSVPVGMPYVATVTSGTGFTIKSTSSSDTAVVVAWFIVQGAAAP